MRLPLLAQVGLITASIFLILRQLFPLAQLIRDFPLNDFSVYMNGVEYTLKDNPYILKFFDYYNYPPAATLFFYSFFLLPTDIAELIFTGLSVLSLFITLLLLIRLARLKPALYVILTTYYLLLRFHSTRLTLTLGQINLIVLLLLILTFYFYRRGRGVLSGITLALSFIFKFTPAFLLLFFFLKRQFRLIASFMITVVVLNLAAIIIFGWPLTAYYYSQVLPQLLTQTGFHTAQLTYMNQSLTALLGRLGIFDLPHLIVKSAIILPLLYLLCRRRLDFAAYALFIVFMTIFLPTFAWQHHYVFLLPAVFLLALRHLPLGIIAYLLLNSTITPAFPGYAHPLVHSHLFLVGLLLFIVLFMVKFPPWRPKKVETEKTE